VIEESLFSVIVPTYNRSHLLPRAINSILNQTYNNFEIIIVNDGSTDTTEEIMNSFGDNRIVTYTHKKNKGVLAAINSGFNLAKGKYIVTVGDDDELLPNALETAARDFRKYSAKSIKILWYDCIDAEIGELSGGGPENECDVSYEMLLCSKFNKGDHWIVLDKETLIEDRFDESLWGNEGQLWLKLLRKFKSHYIPKVLYKAYRQHGERLSIASPLKHLEKNIRTKNAYFENFGEDLKQICPKRYGTLLFNLGLLQILNNQKKESRNSLKKSIKYKFSMMCFALYLLEWVLTSSQIKILCKWYSKNL
jgi:GalNAc5-diNAcBac-PP-undecaprenol beta-1,3-glucosyltransferase